MTPHPWRGQRGLALALVFAAAKSAGAAARHLPHSLWLPSALFFDDVLVGMAFWLIDRALGRPRWMWFVYGAFAGWAALNVPVVWALSSPLTWPMLRAARGPLRDSIGAYLTPANFAVIGAIALWAVAAPSVLARTRRPFRAGLAILGTALAAAGPFAASRVDLDGRERSAITTLITTSRPRVGSAASSGDWRTSPISGAAAQDLTGIRGAARGMNVVLVALESTGTRYLHSYGAVEDPTPNLSALAKRSIQFDRAYTVYPESIKGLFAVLCSKAPAFDVTVDVLVRKPCASLPAVLSAHGYRTALFHSGRFAYLGMADVVARQRFDLAADAGAIGGRVESSFGVDEPSTVAKMLQWIDSVGNRNFFLTYLPIAGHHPYAAVRPGPFTGGDEISAYRNAIHDGDAALGTLLAGLALRGLTRNTLIVVYGDHGEAFGQHAGNFGHTMFLYDENVRVPLLVALPMGAPPARVPDVASTIDIAPTILDLLGISRPHENEGVSLLDGRPRLAFFFTDYSLPLVGLQDGCWKFIHQVDRGRSRLFDTCTDTDERHDVAAEQPSRVQAYRERAMAWAESRRAAINATP